MISFAMSEMVALVLEAMAYGEHLQRACALLTNDFTGMYLILFFACLSVAFTRRKEQRGFNYKFLVTSLLLFVLITWVCTPPVDRRLVPKATSSTW